MAVETFDTVVVGAGVVGCACALELARAGQRVAVMEKDGIASGSSTHATGSLSLLSTDFASEEYLAVGRDAYVATKEVVAEIEELTGADVLLQTRPGLRLALEEAEEETIRDALVWQSRYVAAEWVDTGTVLELEDRLSPLVRGGALEPETSQLDSSRYTLALAGAAERRGASVLSREVVGLLTQGGKVSGVRHRLGEVHCDAVVVAMGAWSAGASSWIGTQVPVRPLAGERLLLDLPGPPLGAIIFSPRRGHMISRRDGFLSVGSTAGRDVDDMSRYLLSDVQQVMPTEEALYELLGRAAELLPTAIEEATVVQRLAGFRPLSPDRRAIVGKAPGMENVVVATGHGTKGIHLAALTARWVADLVLGRGGQVPDCVALGRFAAGRSDSSRRSTLVFALDD